MYKTRESITDVWGERTPYVGDWPERVDQYTVEEPETWVQSACVLCSNGCGMDIGVKDGKIVGVRGRGIDASNRGRLGPKGMHGWVANASKDRLTYPMIRRNGQLERATWDEAMNLIVERTKDIVAQHTSSVIGFYGSGQLFHEEYYTLGIIGKGGLGTPHMDGNTRLCTATSAAAMKESFGSDGQVGSYTDLDTTDTIMHFGHNIASQQTVLWMRVLDRLHGPKRPKLIVVDPRVTATAKEADVHLAPRLGTNVALLNGLLHLILKEGQLDHQFIREHTVGFESLQQAVESCTPEWTQEVTNVPIEKLREAAAILGTTRTLVSTVLQGVYHSNQGTAAAVQVNNIHIVRGLVAKPGCGILQMNGQPTAQNTRESGADGDLPGFRNWGNPKHVEELARLWNVDVNIIPHWSPPTHAMQIFRYAEQGSIKLLWIMGTNPMVSMPNIHRIRETLKKEGLFVIVQDAFLNETTEFADVVLPAAIWGEKTGCFTNAGRTVHISHKAIDPPGEARSDFDIFLDYAKRMDFRDKDGAPLIKWSTPEEAFEGWKECSRGRPCDYTGLSYAKLTGGSGISWPCNEKYPDGTPHLYTDFVFNTDADYCETYGQDFDTGAATTPEEYRAHNPAGRALIKSAVYRTPSEVPDEGYPLWYTTGRLVYHFHTRTKTGRSKELRNAAPDAFVQISTEDAAKYGISEGDMIEVKSRRGSIIEPARIGDIEPGLVFVPFHYGHWDNPESRPRAANELTITGWDPVSKEPYFKYAAVHIQKVANQPAATKGYTVEEFVDKSDGAIKRMVETATATTMQEV